MNSIPNALQAVVKAWSSTFSESVFKNFLTLLQGAILVTGRRTISRMLRVVDGIAEAHSSSFHRLFSHRRWSMWPLARALAQFVVSEACPRGVIQLVGDETVTEHPGRKVFGKARHRDPKRSSHSYVAHLWGHKWVVLAILVQLPGTNRTWALPILVALYRDPKQNKADGRRHKTPVDLMRQLLRVMLRWFPTRKLAFSGDGGYATHALTRFAHRYGKRLTLISRFHADAALYARPPRTASTKRGRPRVKGMKCLRPEQVVAKTTRRQKLRVSWYSGERRQVEVVTGTGQWYRAGEGIAEVLWVYVHCLTGNRRDEYFYTTDLTLSPRQVIETFTGRWAIEVMFQEVRHYIGLESTRGWCQQTVLRAEPCLFGLYTLVALWYAALPQQERQQTAVNWSGKKAVTFSDAITFVRRDLWRHWIFEHPQYKAVVEKLSHTRKKQLIEVITLAL
jgi:hypothetical protein